MVDVSPGADLASVVSKAASGTTLLLAPGTYKVPTMIQFTKPDVTLRSKSGKREDVILDGNSASTPLNPANFTTEILSVRASNIALADITIRYARYHAVHVHPASGTSTSGFLMHNVRIYDTGEQLVKVNSNGETNPGWANLGIIECSLLEFVDNSVMEPWEGVGYYTGGIDVHGGENWIVRHNTFRNIQKDAEEMEHAVHFWTKSRGTLVENNRFENVYRAIGFGMKTSPNGHDRKYPDGRGDAPYFDHLDGIIRNNVIFNASGVHLESGIELLNVSGTEVYHNTLYSVNTPFSGIEYRWPNTKATIKNNLLGFKIVKRDGAVAELAGNLENAATANFVDISKGDFHLVTQAGSSSPINQGVVLASGKAGLDFDGKTRDDKPDIGAYEFNGGNAIRPAFAKITGPFTGWLFNLYARASHRNCTPIIQSPGRLGFLDPQGRAIPAFE
jgi:hypothetical protein